MALRLRSQETPFDDSRSRHFFLPHAGKPFRATAGVLRMYTREQIAGCLLAVQLTKSPRLIALDHDLIPDDPGDPDPGDGRDVAAFLATQTQVVRWRPYSPRTTHRDIGPDCPPLPSSMLARTRRFTDAEPTGPRAFRLACSSSSSGRVSILGRRRIGNGRVVRGSLGRCCWDTMRPSSIVCCLAEEPL